MNADHKAHLKHWSPAYIIVAILTAGGGTAAFTNNLPVTQGQFIEHQNGMHSVAELAINEINQSLNGIRLEQCRSDLRAAYSDKCHASGDALQYIDKEIDRLETLYFKLTKREFDPPPCNN